MQAGRASLLLRDGEHPVLLMAASVGIESSVVAAVRVHLGEGIAGIVAERGAHFFGSRGTTTFISVPVRTERGVEGVFSVTDRVGGTQFAAEHIPQAEAVAGHMANLLSYDRHMAYDSLSGLPNRQAFEEMVRRELARSKRVGHPFAVASVQVDSAASDAALRDTMFRGAGRALQGIVRRYDSVGHLGNGEFAVLLGVPYQDSNEIYTRIMRTVSAVALDMEAEVIVRIGLARCPDDGTGVYDLMTVAGQRMAAEKPAQHVSREGPGMLS